jgi:hypothetical protein
MRNEEREVDKKRRVSTERKLFQLRETKLRAMQSSSSKVRLHYGKNGANLVRFKNAKKNFCF